MDVLSFCAGFSTCAVVVLFLLFLLLKKQTETNTEMFDFYERTLENQVEQLRHLDGIATAIIEKDVLYPKEEHHGIDEEP